MQKNPQTEESTSQPLLSQQPSTETSSGSSSSSQTFPSSPFHPKDQDKLQNLLALKELLQLGIIDQNEFDIRKQQLIDEITKTSCQVATSDPSSYTRIRDTSFFMPLPKVVPCDPPESFDDLPLEHAIKHVFEVDENQNRVWIQYPICVRICKDPFARGSQRTVYHMMEYDDMDNLNGQSTPSESAAPSTLESSEKNENSPTTNSNDIHFDTRLLGNKATAEQGIAFGKRVTFVCKESNNKDIDIDSCFRDVEMQNLCNIYADRFNSYNPPRKIHFNKAWLVELIDRPNHPVVAVERFMPGRYTKHNNNYGYVNTEDRNTPQAFSHFTYEVSGKTLIIVDIQGVEDLYTDPQIHTIDSIAFGQGNLGQLGFDKFLFSHHCNRICKYLKLSPINPKGFNDNGTLPKETFMRETHIKTLQINNINKYQSVEYFVKYQQDFDKDKMQKEKKKSFLCCGKQKFT